MSMPLDSINLAREPDFRLGPLTVRPALGALGRGERSVRVEPRVMQVLVVLARSNGKVVARDALLTACWGDVVVGDDALNRCIQRLRAALRELEADDVRIETVPRVGYCLAAPEARPDGAGPILEPGTGAPATRPQAAWRSWAIRPVTVGVVLLLVALGALAAWVGGWIGRAPGVWTVARTAPLTASPGRETWPVVSPDGGRLVYSARIEDEANTDLYLQSTDGGQPIRLTDDPRIDVAAVWSPDGARIVWSTYDPATPCTLWTMAVPGGTPRELARCRVSTLTRAAFTGDGGGLVYADRPAPDAPHQLYLLSLSDGVVRPLTRAPQGTWGHTDPVLSPDGGSLAFIDTPAWNVADVAVMDLESGAIRHVTGDGARIGGVAWLSDGALVFTSDRSGDWGIWTMRPGDAAPRRLAPGLNELGRLSVARHTDRLVVEAWTYHTDLVRVPVARDGVAAEEASFLTRTTAMDYDADSASDGTLAFISTRSGTPEIWVEEPEGEPRMITRLDGPAIHGLRWSPDGRLLAFALARNGNWDIHVVARDGSGLRRVTRSPAEDLAPVWSPDGAEIWFSSRRTGGWRIWRRSLAAPVEEEAVPMTGEGPMTVRLAPDGSGFFTMVEGEPGIRFITMEAAGWEAAGELVVADASSTDWPSWAVDGDHLWYVRRPDDGAPELVRARPAGGEGPALVDAVLPLPQFHPLAGLSLLPDGALLTSRLVTYEIDLMKLDLVLED